MAKFIEVCKNFIIGNNFNTASIISVLFICYMVYFAIALTYYICKGNKHEYKSDMCEERKYKSVYAFLDLITSLGFILIVFIATLLGIVIILFLCSIHPGPPKEMIF